MTVRQDEQASTPCVGWIFFSAPQIWQPVAWFFFGTEVPPDIALADNPTARLFFPD
jgi:hypothetical protein